jgi:hypothetical protein
MTIKIPFGFNFTTPGLYIQGFSLVFIFVSIINNKRKTIMSKKNSLFARYESAIISKHLVEGEHLLIGHKAKDGWLILQSDRETKRYGGKIYLVSATCTWKQTKDRKWKLVCFRPLPVALSFEVAAGLPHHSFYKQHE